MGKRVIVEKVTKRGQTDELDREFRRQAGHEARWAVAWEMVLEVERVRGKSPGELRLQRTVETVVKRG